MILHRQFEDTPISSVEMFFPSTWTSAYQEMATNTHAHASTCAN